MSLSPRPRARAAAPLPLADHLRQMLALLEGERQALAALDLERIITCADGKMDLCAIIEGCDSASLDEESRGLLDAVGRLNAINRRLRNLIASNMQTRFAALTGRSGLYSQAGAGSAF